MLFYVCYYAFLCLSYAFLGVSMCPIMFLCISMDVSMVDLCCSMFFVYAYLANIWALLAL